MIAPTKFEQTHIHMVLDRSSSMSVCRQATIDAVNKYLHEAREDALLKEADFALSIFDSQSIDKIRDGAPCRLADLTSEDFVPRGMTPLFDAIGRGVDDLDGKLKASGSTKAILVIVTDGQENASRRYSHSAITEMIKSRQAAGWLVVFLGAGLEAARQGLALGIQGAYTADIAMDKAALAETSSVMRGMTSSYAAHRDGAEAKAWMDKGGGAISAADRKLMGDATAGEGLKKKRFDAVSPPLSEYPQRAADEAKKKAALKDSWDKAQEGVDRDAWSK